MSDESKVVVYLLEKRPDGTVAHIGNSYECAVDEAVYLIEQKEAKAEHAPIGVVPPEWLE